MCPFGHKWRARGMKKRIKNFFTGIVGLVLLGAIFNVDPKKIGSAIGIITIIAAVAAICYVVYLLIKFFVWLSRLYSESSPTSTPSSTENLDKITITVDEPAPSRFSASIDKADYDYASKEITLYEIWNENTYTVKLNANGGRFVVNANSVEEYEFNVKYTEEFVISNIIDGNSINRNGYKFASFSGKNLNDTLSFISTFNSIVESGKKSVELSIIFSQM